MPSFDVAHVYEQGQNMLLFPLDRKVGFKTLDQQRAILHELEDRAHGAGLAGQAAIFWEGNGRTHFLGPKAWRNFLGSIGMSDVLASVNRSISW